MENVLAASGYFLKPGYLYYAGEPNIIYTVLGSAVMVCLYDRRSCSAGTCLYRYPATDDGKKATAEYGNAALPALIRMMEETGSHPAFMEAMIFGGADREKGERTGEENVRLARCVLKKKRIRIMSEDVSGFMGRKVVYHTATNQAVIYKIRTLREMDWFPYCDR